MIYLYIAVTLNFGTKIYEMPTKESCEMAVRDSSTENGSKYYCVEVLSKK